MWHSVYVAALLVLLVCPLGYMNYNGDGLVAKTTEFLPSLSVANLDTGLSLANGLLETTKVYLYMKSDFVISLVLIVCFYFSYKSVEAYFNHEMADLNTVDAHSIHVIFPKVDDLRKDQEKPNAMNMTYAQMANLALVQLTMRQVHRHFSEKFGEIHRIYIGRDYHQMHADSVDFLQRMRKEMKAQLNCEMKYFNTRGQVDKHNSKLKY